MHEWGAKLWDSTVQLSVSLDTVFPRNLAAPQNPAALEISQHL